MRGCMITKKIRIAFVLMVILFAEFFSFAGNLGDTRYACIPVAASFALKYFDIPHSYEEVYSEIRVQKETGFAPLEDLLVVCRRRGLECQAFKGLSKKKVKSYLDDGYIVAACIYNNKTKHVVSLVSANSRIIAFDAISPLHYINEAKFDAWLKDDQVVNIVIGKEALKSSQIQWKAWLSLAIIVVMLIVIFKRKELK